MSTRRARYRFRSCAVALAAALLVLATQLALLHLGSHEEELQDIGRNRRWTKQIDVSRGKIYDREGGENILALDLVAKDVCADPDLVVSNQAVVAVAVELSKLLDLPVDRVAMDLNRPGKHYVCLRRAMQAGAANDIAARKLTGVFLQENTVRFYPHDTFLCHVLGFVNHEGKGVFGVEQGMDRFLRGSPGVLESEKNAFRQELYWKRERYVPPVLGGNVTLTIDQYVQYIVEKALDSIGDEHDSLTWKGAWAIVQDVRTGEILALASRPAYNLNDFTESSEIERLNRAIGVVYEPGSTLKSIAFAAALNEGLTTPDTVIDCEDGRWMHRNRPLRDYHAYDRLTVADGLKKSSNILTAKLAVGLGEARFDAYLRAFGLGQRTGIDLPGEEAGILHPVSDWSGLSASRIAIGQGVAVTALQMAALYGAIANDGLLMQPYVVRRVAASDGTVLYERRPEAVGQPITPETAALMRRLLARVTEADGTGRRAHIDGYKVAGKTGTAQKPIPGGYSTTDHMASFVGFLPAEAPRFTVVVVVDEPQPIHTGGAVAAPVFCKIASEVARYLEIPADDSPVLAAR